MTDEELKAIEERAAHLLPGPWRLEPAEFRPTRGGRIVDAYGTCVAGFESGAEPNWVDATFMTAAREDVPRLLEEVRRLRAELVSHCVAEQLSSGSQTGCDHAAGHCEMFALTRPK